MAIRPYIRSPNHQVIYFLEISLNPKTQIFLEGASDNKLQAGTFMRISRLRL